MTPMYSSETRGQPTNRFQITVLGAKEMEERAVSIRVRDAAQSDPQVVLSLDDAFSKFKALKESRGLENKL